jgi:hypothetical protein
LKPESEVPYRKPGDLKKIIAEATDGFFLYPVRGGHWRNLTNDRKGKYVLSRESGEEKPGAPT